MNPKKHFSVTHMRLKSKILSIIMFCITLVLLFAFISNQYISCTYNDVLYRSISNSLSYSSNEILQQLDSINTLTYKITKNDKIQSNLSSIKDSGVIYSSDYNELYSLLLSFYSESKNYNVINLSIFTDQYTIHTNTSAAKHVPKEVYDSVIATADAADGASTWVTKYCQDYGLFIAKKIRRIESLKLDDLGVEIFHIDINSLIHSCISLNQYENFIYLLTNENQEIIYNPNTLTEEEVLHLQSSLPKTYGIVKLRDNKYFLTSDTIDEYTWDYICLIPYNLVFQSIRNALAIGFLLILFCLILVLFVSEWLVRQLTGHFKDLIKQMDYFAHSDPTQVALIYDYPSGDDEISMLYKHFNHMTQEISDLIRTNYANQLLMKEAQIKALEMQINPHFLYNTLETINWRAKSIGERDISIMVESLAKLLRVTLDRNFALLPLSQELQLIQSYILIQQIRFEERLDYQEEIPQAYVDALIPKLTLQPIVENAIRHAMEKTIEVCHIRMTIEKHGGELMIFIKNNGSQYEEDLLERLRNGSAQTSGHGIGLLNIDKRIKLTFGNQYGLSLYNEDDLAITLVVIPYHTNPK